MGRGALNELIRLALVHLETLLMMMNVCFFCMGYLCLSVCLFVLSHPWLTHVVVSSLVSTSGVVVSHH